MTLGADPANAKVSQAVALVQERIRWFSARRPAVLQRRDGGLHQRAHPCSRRLLWCRRRAIAWPPAQRATLGRRLELRSPPSTRSSFHSTICVLEGLLAYEQAHGAKPAVTEARARARDYLLERRMLRSLTTGEVIDPRWTSFSFPVVWYDVLRGLDCLRSAGVKPDTRMAEPSGSSRSASTRMASGVSMSFAAISRAFQLRWRQTSARQALEHTARASCARLARA